MKQRLLNILIALDQLIYVVVTLGYGMPDETMSGAAWRTEQGGRVLGRFFRPIIDQLFWFDPQHCQASHEAARQRAKARN